MNWPTTSLGEIAKISSGDGAPQDRSVFGGSGLPFIRAGSLAPLMDGFDENQLELISADEASKRRMRTYPSGTIVFAKSGMSSTKGLVYELKGPAHVVNHLAALECGDEVYPRFLLRWLQANSPARLIANPAYPSIKISAIRSESIPLPPLAEQKKIAAILDAADDLRAKRRESLSQLDSLLQSTFLDMFGDPVTNPMGWPKRLLSETCSKITDGTHHSPPTFDSGVPYITAKHIKADGLRFFDDPWYVTPEHHKKIFARCDPRHGDVLYIKDGVTTGIAVVNRYDFEFSMLSSLALLRPLESSISNEYLCAYLNAERNKSVLTSRMGGAAIKRLTLVKIKAFEIPIPPLDLQNRFAAIVDTVEQQKAKQRVHLEELDTLFASLQSRAFTGKL